MIISGLDLLDRLCVSALGKPSAHGAGRMLDQKGGHSPVPQRHTYHVHRKWRTRENDDWRSIEKRSNSTDVSWSIDGRYGMPPRAAVGRCLLILLRLSFAETSTEAWSVKCMNLNARHVYLGYLILRELVAQGGCLLGPQSASITRLHGAACCSFICQFVTGTDTQSSSMRQA
ncbi:hypothetical protein EJ03DRAFT_94171 [Teratosphaeria nubilosa]|uniref:Uncharacterized protein n=1 Tax=Teratosphaeria nubilosa TaxID=161662 RepID=A0A6G1LAB7_9PEZI|nr:hypothetical protein EJ03DRAFT_94171 [Teratosphaeria nubilosa]